MEFFSAQIIHDIVIVLLGGVFGVTLGKLPSWAFYTVLGIAVLLMIIVLGS